MLSTYNVVFASVRGCAQRSALLLILFLLAHVAIGKADAVSALERARSLDMPAATVLPVRVVVDAVCVRMALCCRGSQAATPGATFTRKELFVFI